MGAPPEDLREQADEARRAFGRLETRLDALDDAGAAEPSGLPGWTRAHVITHLARNADGQRRMLKGALAGEVIAQYDSDASREADIEEGATRPAAALREDLRSSQRRLEAVWERMTPETWVRPTAARVGERPAWWSVWARWREVDVHHVDLRMGYRPSDWPDALVARALPQSLASIGPRLPEGRVRLVDSGTGVVLVEAGKPGRPETVISGGRCWLLAWVLGRHADASDALHAHRDGQETALPHLAPWA